MPITAEYDREADALYVRLNDGERVRAIEINDTTFVDVTEDDLPVGLEFLYASSNIALDDAVKRFGLERQVPDLIRAIGSTGSTVAIPTVTGGQFLASTSIVTVAVEGTVSAAVGVPTTTGVAPLSDGQSGRLIVA